MWLTFVEAVYFSADWRRHRLDDDDLQTLQQAIGSRPDVGPVGRGTGGVRKVRYAPAGRGKSGAFRVCYLPVLERGLVALLVVYGKNEKSSLTNAERAVLRTVTARIKAGAGW